MRSTTEVFQDHLAKRLAGEIEADIRQNYASDVVILTGTGVLHGHAGVWQSAKQLNEYMQDGSFVYRHTLVDGKYAFLEWTAASKTRTVSDGADSFVVEDGLIVMQSIHYTVENKPK